MNTFEQLTIELKALEDAAHGCTISEFQRGYVTALAYTIQLLRSNGESK